MPVDETEGCLRAFVQLKQQYSKMKVILSVGGGGKGSENFAAVAHSRSRLDTFVRSARALVDEFGLDGIDGTSLDSFAVLGCIWGQADHLWNRCYSGLGTPCRLEAG